MSEINAEMLANVSFCFSKSINAGMFAHESALITQYLVVHIIVWVINYSYLATYITEKSLINVIPCYNHCSS